MASPSPVPPYFRVVVTSAWVNGSKTLETCSTVMPTPVSVTTNSMWHAPSTSHRCTSQRDRAVARELGRVAEQVQQDLPRLDHVPVHRLDAFGEADGQRVAVLVDHRRERIEQLVDQIADDERLERHAHLAGFDLREVEDAVDQLEQVLAGRLDAAEVGDRRLFAAVGRLLLRAARCRGGCAFSGVRSSWLMLARKSLLARVAFFGPALGDAKLVDEDGQLLGVLLHACRAPPRARRCARAVWPHLDHGAAARHHQEDVLEDHPGGVLEPAPLAGDDARRRPTAARRCRAACDRARRRPSPAPARASRGRRPGRPATRRRGSAFRCGRR